MSVLIEFNCFDQLFVVPPPPPLLMGPGAPLKLSPGPSTPAWAVLWACWFSSMFSWGTAVPMPSHGWTSLTWALTIFLAWSQPCLCQGQSAAYISLCCHWPWSANWFPGIISDLPPRYEHVHHPDSWLTPAAIPGPALFVCSGAGPCLTTL